MINEKSVIQPFLSEEYLQDLTEILKKAGSLMAGRERANWIANNIPDSNNNEVLDEMRFRSLLLLLRDLFSQGWELTFKDGIANIHHPITPDNVETKQWYKDALLRERNKQLENDSIKKFILKMEKERNYNGDKVSIRNLILPVNQLLSDIEDYKEDAVRPYLQIIQSSSEKDEKTGFKLLDIWRYFRLTWTLPHKPTPGRNIFLLVRDSAQEYHPIIGIAALGSSIVQITCRDNEIGWTLEGIRERMDTMNDVTAGQIINSLSHSLVKSISGIEFRDLIGGEVNILNAKDYENTLSTFLKGTGSRPAAPRISSNLDEVNWSDVCQSPFYKVKRAKALLKLFKAQSFFSDLNINEPLEALRQLIMTSRGRSALSTALQSNKKEKVGANMMDIIVCGAIPPYNYLLGGKLISMLMMSPELTQEYQRKYKNQISVIASAMKGEPVVKPANLVFLGTTSLYETGSSQYNRLTIPKYALNDNEPLHKIGFKPLGVTKGFGTVYISDETVEALSGLTTKLHGRRVVNNTFGEGTSPRMRLIRAGLDALGLPSNHLLNHNFKRIVYGVKLADNAYEYLRGEENEPCYFLNQDKPHEMTEAICEFWRKRWLAMRINNNDIIQKLSQFDSNKFLLGHNYFENK
ncbi:Druantia anti-phage system protein DruA [Paenibacillus brevis]|uniref:DUF4338 domain-containing protein n=1 Tax=Paenibacillus brevis TaxID=2841508 RepID=A0ABS6FM81_9BACL|nr:Druantia anti-phage system protein DruA [Paenibacillus brevis]MBU5671066.1 DUF4338 domain-containing protein [Paenibacillus brevis]